MNRKHLRLYFTKCAQYNIPNNIAIENILEKEGHLKLLKKFKEKINTISGLQKLSYYMNENSLTKVGNAIVREQNKPMQKKAFISTLIATLLAGSAGLGTGAYLYNKFIGAPSEEALKKEIEKQQLLNSAAQYKMDNKHKYNANTLGGIGALAGGYLGYNYGENMFPDYTPSNAKFLGTLVGGVGGGIAGASLHNLMNDPPKAPK